LRDFVSEKISPIARPKSIVFTDGLPKTRSGKIMRRLLKDISGSATSATSPPWPRRRGQRDFCDGFGAKTED
jgi:acyl-CoA synthetase (AMP-forming)/AMP-acid ligase II